MNLPDWLHAVLVCPECGRPCIRTPSDYMGCRVAGHMKLHSRPLVNEMVGDAYDLARRTGKCSWKSVETAKGKAWGFLRKNYRLLLGEPLKRSGKVWETGDLFADCACDEQTVGVEQGQ